MHVATLEQLTNSIKVEINAKKLEKSKKIVQVLLQKEHCSNRDYLVGGYYVQN